MVAIDPVEIAPSGSDEPFVNPTADSFIGSGCTDISSVTTGNWYIHTQVCEIMYVRNNQYTTGNGCTRALNGAPVPYVDWNFLDANIRVHTNDTVMYNATFSSCAQTLQRLVLVPSGSASGGFGIQGTVDTSQVGTFRRPVRTDAAGNILDPTGLCDITYNVTFDKAPGEYSTSSGFDTSATRNASLFVVLSNMKAQCPTFDANLIALT